LVANKQNIFTEAAKDGYVLQSHAASLRHAKAAVLNQLQITPSNHRAALSNSINIEITQAKAAQHNRFCSAAYKLFWWRDLSSSAKVPYHPHSTVVCHITIPHSTTKQAAATFSEIATIIMMIQARIRFVWVFLYIYIEFR
jgi:hypothetical protein